MRCNLAVVSHRGPFWDHSYLLFTSMIFPFAIFPKNLECMLMIPHLPHQPETLWLNKIELWLSANKLTLNFKRTKFMLIESQYKLSHINKNFYSINRNLGTDMKNERSLHGDDVTIIVEPRPTEGKRRL